MSISATSSDGVVTLTLDDGKANALDFQLFAELGTALDEYPDEPLVLCGREGVFSAGLNTKLLAELDDAGVGELLEALGRAVLRVWLEPRPVAAAATGHAVAGGALLAMAADHTVAAAGEFRWGLSETSIGFPLPRWAIAVARGNLRTDRLDDLLLPGALVPPEEAVEAGFADALAEPGDVLAVAFQRARELAELPRKAYAETKRRLRGDAADAVLSTIKDDARALLAAR